MIVATRMRSWSPHVCFGEVFRNRRSRDTSWLLRVIGIKLPLAEQLAAVHRLIIHRKSGSTPIGYTS